MNFKKILLLSIIVATGIILMSGSYFGKPDAYKDPIRLKVNEHNLNTAQKIELDKLKKEERKLNELYKKQFERVDSIAKVVIYEETREGFVIGKMKYPKKYEKSKDALNKIDNARRETRKKIDAIARESQKSCFPKETQILLSDGTFKEIGALNKGDTVTVYDIANDSITVSQINDIMIDTNNHYYVLNNDTKATAYERFLTKDGWKRIRNIQKGDEIFNGNSYEKVVSIEKIIVNDKVYNLNIENNHNFFVSSDGTTQMLVHNSPSGGGGSSGGGSSGGSK